MFLHTADFAHMVWMHAVLLSTSFCSIKAHASSGLLHVLNRCLYIEH